MTVSRETIEDLAPSKLESYRSSRYRGDDQAIPLSDLAPEDRPVITYVYGLLSELVELASDAHDNEDPSPLLAFVARHDIAVLVHRIRRLGGGRREDERVAQAIHDIRGGALSTLFVQLARVGRIPYRAEMGRSIFIAARDHMKMMRNVTHDLDPPARLRDVSFLPHSLVDLERALRQFSARVHDEPVTVDVECPTDAVIAESCVECGAIDRIAYNLLNNAVSYADGPSFRAWLMLVSTNLRVAIANPLSESQQSGLTPLMAANPGALFGAFTTSGSGYGLRIVSELVGRAYGVASVETLTQSGYIGARIVDDSFVSWFHWPLSGS